MEATCMSNSRSDQLHKFLKRILRKQSKHHFLVGVGGRAQDLMLKENIRYKNVSITCLHICKNIHLYMYRKKTGRKHNVLNHTRLLFWRSYMTEHGHLWEVVLNILFFLII